PDQEQHNNACEYHTYDNWCDLLPVIPRFVLEICIRGQKERHCHDAKSDNPRKHDSHVRLRSPRRIGNPGWTQVLAAALAIVSLLCVFKSAFRTEHRTSTIIVLSKWLFAHTRDALSSVHLPRRMLRYAALDRLLRSGHIDRLCLLEGGWRW